MPPSFFPSHPSFFPSHPFFFFVPRPFFSVPPVFILAPSPRYPHSNKNIAESTGPKKWKTGKTPLKTYDFAESKNDGEIRAESERNQSGIRAESKRVYSTPLKTRNQSGIKAGRKSEIAAESSGIKAESKRNQSGIKAESSGIKKITRNQSAAKRGR